MKTKIRIKDLETGDRFEMQGREYKVRFITDTEIIYADKTGSHGGGRARVSGVPSFRRARYSNLFIYKITTEVYELHGDAGIKKRETAVYSIQEEARPWRGRERNVGGL